MTQRSKSNQIQEQKLEQRQSLSQYQVQFVRLLELPTEGLEERVRAELLENPALEEADNVELPMNTVNQDSDNSHSVKVLLSHFPVLPNPPRFSPSRWLTDSTETSGISLTIRN